MQGSSRRGLALLIVVGVLGVLAMLALAFATLTRLERRASLARVAQTRALLAARSGVEDVLARMSAGQDGDQDRTRYLGEDWDANGALTGWEDSDEVVRDGILDRDTCPPGQAMRPSFSALDGLGNPLLTNVDGRRRGRTGRLGEGLEYSVRVQSGGIHVNGGDPAFPLEEPGLDILDPPVRNYNAMLRRILGTLAEALDREDGLDNGKPVDQVDGERLIDLRPASGWAGWSQLRDLALGGSDAKLGALRPYLLLHARPDLKVIRPSFAAPMLENLAPSSWGSLNAAHFAPLPSGDKAPDFERIPVLAAGGRVVGRAPVSLPWARRRGPALLALMAGLSGLYLDEAKMRARWALGTGTDDALGEMELVTIQNAWDPMDDAHRALDKILSHAGEVSTWEEWDALCDTIEFAGKIQFKRDLLKANFNPNSRLNRLGANPSMWRSVDKLDLIEYSPEWILQATGPVDVTGIARVVDPQGRLLASRTVSVSVGESRVLRLTTQREFVCRSLGSLDVAGDETAVRLPGSAGPFIPPSAGLEKTWGHALPVPAIAGRGMGLQSCPEPCVNDGGGLSMRPADWDGSLQLASLETEAEEYYGTSSAVQDQRMLGRYTVGLNLEVADGNPTCQPDAALPTTAELRNTLFHSLKRNPIRPDGCYSEWFATPSYLTAGNLHGFRGLMSFWVRPNHALPAMGNRRGHPYVRASNVQGSADGGAPENQMFFLGDAVIPATWGGDGRGVSPARIPFLAQFEIGHDTSDVLREHRFNVPHGDSAPQRRWRLVTFQWDLQSPNKNDAGELILDDGVLAQGSDKLLGQDDLYPGSTGNDPATAADLTLPDANGPHRIHLGGRYPDGEGLGTNTWIGSGADATFDEFAVYDFGAGGGPLPSVFAANRFREGRYYKKSDYAGLTASAGTNTAGRWFSPPIDLGKARLLSIAWTQVVPRGLRSPAGAEPEDGDPGPDGRILMELAAASGASYLPDAAGTPIDTAFDRSGGQAVNRRVAQPFRLHAVFQPNLSDPDNTAILDPLALDDVTVVYEPLDGRPLLGWSEGSGS